MSYKQNKPARLISFKLAKLTHEFKRVYPNVTRLGSDEIYKDDGSLEKWPLFGSVVAFRYIAAYKLESLKHFIEKKYDITFNTRNKKLEKDLTKFMKKRLNIKD